MADLGRDETAEPGPSDRDLTEDGTGRLGLAFNNPYLQRVCVDSMFSCNEMSCLHYSSEYTQRERTRNTWHSTRGKSLGQAT